VWSCDWRNRDCAGGALDTVIGADGRGGPTASCDWLADVMRQITMAMMTAMTTTATTAPMMMSRTVRSSDVPNNSAANLIVISCIGKIKQQQQQQQQQLLLLLLLGLLHPFNGLFSIKPWVSR